MPKNPYEILNIPPSSSEEQIKEAYKQLARKYQSEWYAGGPLSDIAQKKMNELDEAYDEIMLSRRSTGNKQYKSSKEYREPNQSHGSRYPDIRAKIAANRIDDAETLLDGELPDSRDAEWHYLKGLISQQRGWLDEAENYFSTACGMDGANLEYASAYNRMRNNRSGGYRTARERGTNTSRSRQCSGCDICSGLLCADCCCECMGGDCIPCC